MEGPLVEQEVEPLTGEQLAALVLPVDRALRAGLQRLVPPLDKVLDAFLTLPGGIGTMEEFFETLTAGYLSLHDEPHGLLNLGGFYAPLIEFLELTVARGLAKPRLLEVLHVHGKPEPLLDLVLGPRPT